MINRGKVEGMSSIAHVRGMGGADAMEVEKQILPLRKLKVRMTEIESPACSG